MIEQYPPALPTQPTAEQSKIEKPKTKRQWTRKKKIIAWVVAIFVLIYVTGLMGDDSESNKPHIAVVNIHGVISADEDDVNAKETIALLLDAYLNENSVAIALSIDSPGGSPYESERIVSEIKKLKKSHPEKKLYAVIEGMAASAGYHIASATDEIYAGRSSLVGSVGVLLMNYDARELQKKIGIYDRTFKAGENKDILSYTQPVTPKQRTHIQSILDDSHKAFIDDVREGRGKRLKEDKDTFTGLFWTGNQAVKLGLADHIGYMENLQRKHKNPALVYNKDEFKLKDLLSLSMSSVGAGIADRLIEVNTQQSVKLR